jgi:hypothetical protein
MSDEQKKVHRIMEIIAKEEVTVVQLVYDRRTQTVRPLSKNEDVKDTIIVEPQDMEVFG